jgi:cell division protein FtsB
VQNYVFISVLLVTALRPAAMEAASESDRLEKLERAVEQLQKRNAELEAEVRSLKQPTAATLPSTTTTISCSLGAWSCSR